MVSVTMGHFFISLSWWVSGCVVIAIALLFVYVVQTSHETFVDANASCCVSVTTYPFSRDNWISDNRKVEWSCIRQVVLHLQFLLAVEHLM